jgi:hypothetical protein
LCAGGGNLPVVARAFLSVFPSHFCPCQRANLLLRLRFRPILSPSLPYSAGGWFCASSLRLIQRVAIHEKYVGPPVVVTIKILTPLPGVWINYLFDSTPPFPLSMRSPAGCATSMPSRNAPPVMCGPRGLESSPNILYHNRGGGKFADVISDLEAVARSIASRFAGQTATARVFRVGAPIVLSL